MELADDVDLEAELEAILEEEAVFNYGGDMGGEPAEKKARVAED